MSKDNLFDDITRILGSPMPRRQAFKLIAGGLAGGSLISLLEPQPAHAAGAKCGQPCGFFTSCIEGKCQDVNGKQMCCIDFCFDACCCHPTPICFPKSDGKTAMCCAAVCGFSICCPAGTKCFPPARCCSSICGPQEECCKPSESCQGKGLNKQCCSEPLCEGGTTCCAKQGMGCNSKDKCCACPKNNKAHINATRSGPPAQADALI